MIIICLNVGFDTRKCLGAWLQCDTSTSCRLNASALAASRRLDAVRVLTPVAIPPIPATDSISMLGIYLLLNYYTATTECLLLLPPTRRSGALSLPILDPHIALAIDFRLRSRILLSFFPSSLSSFCVLARSSPGFSIS